MSLHDLSLLLNCNLSTGTVRLHDVMRSFLIQRAGSHLPALHTRFLETQKHLLKLTDWANLPSNASYLWRFLVWHLCWVEHWEELYTTLTDLRFLANKVLVSGVALLEADLLLVNKRVLPQHLPPLKTAELQVLSHRIVQMSHLLNQVHTFAEISGLLLSYLSWEPTRIAQRAYLEQVLPRPFLTAFHPFPQASSMLVRTLQGHTHKVNECAVSPDGKWIVSASWDHTLKVWELATGKVRFTLQGDMNPFAVAGVTACAISPDGKWIVSASEDKTLKVWDVQTGQCMLTFPMDEEFNRCAFYPDGEHLVACGTQGMYFLRLVV